jgi:hypothetical protein
MIMPIAGKVESIAKSELSTYVSAPKETYALSPSAGIALLPVLHPGALRG